MFLNEKNFFIFLYLDPKRYVAIKYNVRDIVLAVVGMAVISAIYYSNNMVRFIVGAVLAVVYAGVLNTISAVLLDGLIIYGACLGDTGNTQQNISIFSYDCICRYNYKSVDRRLASRRY